MPKFPPSEEILALTPHRPSVEIRLLAGIYDLLREMLPESEGERPLISWRKPHRRKKR